MGFINVEFDANLEVLNWTGNPILLDNTILQGKYFASVGCESGRITYCSHAKLSLL